MVNSLNASPLGIPIDCKKFDIGGDSIGDDIDSVKKQYQHTKKTHNKHVPGRRETVCDRMLIEIVLKWV